MRLNCKPLSVNRCWQGRRFKTKEYLSYEKEMLLRMKPMTLPDKPFTLHLEFGVSNMASDIDNPVKPLVDIMQKKYGFNDKDIMEMHVKKVIVSKGNEYIDYKLK